MEKSSWKTFSFQYLSFQRIAKKMNLKFPTVGTLYGSLEKNGLSKSQIQRLIQDRFQHPR